jgi:hypothetical protein
MWEQQAAPKLRNIPIIVPIVKPKCYQVLVCKNNINLYYKYILYVVFLRVLSHQLGNRNTSGEDYY